MSTQKETGAQLNTFVNLKEDILLQYHRIIIGIGYEISLRIMTWAQNGSGLEEMIRQRRENGFGAMEPSGQWSIGGLINPMVKLLRTVC